MEYLYAEIIYTGIYVCEKSENMVERKKCSLSNAR